MSCTESHMGLLPFIGRKSELHQLEELRPRARALTLVGRGGIGKSRVASELAVATAGGFDDGIRFVDFDGLTAESELRSALSDMAGRSLLLVLDNCDANLDGCARIASDLLRREAGVHILATSREPLRIEGEFVWVMPSMQTAEAVRLFEASARLLQPGFGVAGDDGAVVAEVCARIDNLPAAIQGVAAQVRNMSVNEIRGRLDPAWLLDLEDPLQNAARQRSLRAMLDADYSKLDEFARRLLVRLALLRGDWTLDSIEAVCADEKLPGARITGVLHRLAARWLIQVDHASHPPRYRIPELVREYARGLPIAADDEQTLQRRRARYVISIGRRAEPARMDHAVAADLDREHASMMEAITWAVDARELDLAYELAIIGFGLWYCRGPVSEGRHGLARLLVSNMRDPGLRARVAFLAGQLALLEGDIHAARQLATQSARAAPNGSKDAVATTLALHLRTLIAHASTETFRATALMQATEAALERIDADDRLKRVLDLAVPIANALLALELNDLRRATQLANRAARLARARDDTFWRARAMHAQAMIATRGRQHAIARWLVERAVLAQSNDGDTPGLIESLCALGQIELNAGAVGAALPSFSRAFDLSEQNGFRSRQLVAMEGIACATAASQPESALRLAEACESLRRTTGATMWPRQHHRLLMWLGRGLQQPPTAIAPREYGASRGWTWSAAAALVHDILNGRTGDASGGSDVLTPREREVAGLLTRGLSNQQIASRLAISVGTVRAHVEHILFKLGLHSRAQVALWASREHRLPV
ncbi:MAG: hypothetical protein JO020_14990 [Chloroflexi bacterium]|nr:hypothetical protein [Chloroflexota bacterium]